MLLLLCCSPLTYIVVKLVQPLNIIRYFIVLKFTVNYTLFLLVWLNVHIIVSSDVIATCIKHYYNDNNKYIALACIEDLLAFFFLLFRARVVRRFTSQKLRIIKIAAIENKNQQGGSFIDFGMICVNSIICIYFFKSKNNYISEPKNNY